MNKHEFINQQFDKIGDLIKDQYGFKRLDYLSDLNELYRDQKSALIDLFPDNLKIEIDGDPVVVSYDDFIKDLRQIFYKQYGKKSEYQNTNFYELTDFFNNFTMSDIKNNRLNTDKTIKDHEFKEGIKISKIMSSFFNSFTLELFQIVYSMVLQTIKDLKVKIVLSVDPLDYFIASANTSSWRSCHNWIDGEYKAGSISYMADQNSLIAYAYVRKEEYYGDPLPVKIWREMIGIDLKRLTAIFSRHYPNINKDFEKQVRSLTAGILNKHNGSAFNWHVKRLNNHDNTAIDDEIETNDDQKLYFIHNGLEYHGDTATTAIRLKSVGEYTPIHVGYKYHCLICGEKHRENARSLFCCMGEICNDCGSAIRGDHYYDPDDNVICEHCYYDNYSRCERCENIFHNDGVTHTADDEYICDHCLDRYYSYCGDCGEYYRSSNTSFYEVNGGDRCVCENCIDNYNYCEHCEEYTNDDLINVDGGDRSVCENCIDNYNQCEHCEEYFTDDLLCDSNGDQYCGDCFENIESEVLEA
jgi:hypothetical protein